MNKAIFLDRDGVINKKGGSYYIYKINEFEFNPGVIEALQKFKSRGYLLIVITNQGGVSRKIFNEDQLVELHNFMMKHLTLNNAGLTQIYYCPHHPENEVCECRKPGSLLFEKAIKEYDIDPTLSFMIGDSDVDIIASAKVNITGIKINTNSNMMYLFKDYNF